MVFTEWGPEEEVKYNAGWIMLALMASQFVIQLAFVMVILVTRIKLIIIKYSRRVHAFCKKKWRKVKAPETSITSTVETNTTAVEHSQMKMLQRTPRKIKKART